jgi:hypothetical protein
MAGADDVFMTRTGEENCASILCALNNIMAPATANVPEAVSQ